MYTRFGDNDIVTRQAAELVTSTWTNNTNNLNEPWTSSLAGPYHPEFTTATSSGHFFISIWNKESASAGVTNSDAEVQYTISYGHRAGSGSPDFTNDTGSFGLGASRVIYNQYRQLHYNDDSQYFQFGNYTPDHIYVINVNRARYKQRLTLGSLSLNISAATAGVNDQETVHLTDDSVTAGAPAGNSISLGPYYNIVSGTKGIVQAGTTAGQQVTSASSGGAGATTAGSMTNAGYGFFYPQAGLIILNAEAFSASQFTTPGVNDNGIRPDINIGGPAANTDKNHQRLWNAISAAGHFIVDTTEEINSQFYFARARNNQFNYSNNDSFIDGTNKAIRFETMKNNPKVFITTVGLYNDRFELLAVVKLSQPVAKDFTKEALIRVKLDF